MLKSSLILICIAIIFSSCSQDKNASNNNHSKQSTHVVTQIKGIEEENAYTVDTSNSLNTEEHRKIELQNKPHKEKQLTTTNDSTQINTAISDTPVQVQSTNFHSYEELNNFLSKHVSSNGKVNYKTIKESTEQLELLLNLFKKNYPSIEWTKKEQLAYWINAYNLFTLKLVSDNYPVSSITNISSKPWDIKFIELGGDRLSLNDIEHTKIRSKFNEPRIHFALNCASYSCPILLNRAYIPTLLNQQLEKQTKLFLHDKSKNDFSDDNNIQISQIFDWYQSDFTKNSSLLTFFSSYGIQLSESVKINYLEYSWNLND